AGRVRTQPPRPRGGRTPRHFSRGSYMKNPDVELTEFTGRDPDTLHLVRRGANGFPARLAKSVAAEIGAATSPSFRPSSLPRYVRNQIETQRRHRTLRKVVVKALTESLR